MCVTPEVEQLETNKRLMKKWLLFYRKREQKDSNGGENRLQRMAEISWKQRRSNQCTQEIMWNEKLWCGLSVDLKLLESFPWWCHQCCFFFSWDGFVIIPVRLKLEYYLISAGWDDKVKLIRPRWTPFDQSECYVLRTQAYFVIPSFQQCSRGMSL